MGQDDEVDFVVLDENWEVSTIGVGVFQLGRHLGVGGMDIVRGWDWILGFSGDILGKEVDLTLRTRRLGSGWVSVLLSDLSRQSRGLSGGKESFEGKWNAESPAQK